MKTNDGENKKKDKIKNNSEGYTDIGELVQIFEFAFLVVIL